MRNRSPIRGTVTVALVLLTLSEAWSTTADNGRSDTRVLLPVDESQEVPGPDIPTCQESLDSRRLVAERPPRVRHCIHVQPRADVILWELQELPKTARSDGDIT